MAIAALSTQNAARWAAMQLDQTRLAEFDRVASRLVANKARFQGVEAKTRVPWPVVAVIFERESGGLFTRYLGNGQPLDKVTTEVPAGRGPFLGADAWERGCYDALMDCAPHASQWEDWSVGGALALLERYNGLGYANKGIPSPYVWSGTNQYSRGKYVADHEFDPNAVDKQIGCAPLLARMMALDSTIKFAGPARTVTHPETTVIVAGTVAAGGAAASASGATPVQIGIVIGAALVAAAIIFAIVRSRKT